VNGQSTEPDSNAQTGESQSAKTEVVYARTDATGKKSGVYVVNDFDTPTAQTVTDPGTYTKVQNLSTSEELSNTNGSVTLTTTAGEPVYYQGDLDASTQLPWDVEVTYRLDGKVVSPDELSGKSGKLDIELKVTGMDDDSSTSDFAKSFMLQAQGTFPNDNFHLDDSDDGTVAVVGDNTLVTYLLIPRHQRRLAHHGRGHGLHLLRLADKRHAPLDGHQRTRRRHLPAHGRHLQAHRRRGPAGLRRTRARGCA
jgi:putative membrane protein